MGHHAMCHAKLEHAQVSSADDVQKQQELS